MQLIDKKWSHSLIRIAGLLSISFLLLWLIMVRPVFSTTLIRDQETMVDAERLKKHVETLSGQFVPRSHRDIHNLNRAADYIAAHFRASGGRTYEQTFKARGKDYRNIIAEYGPENGELIIIGAHYDAEGPNPGADDNASGIAGLFELARLLSERSPKSRVMLAAYSIEEPPYFGTDEMGSAVHAKSLKDSGVSVKLMISLEMIGYFSDKEDSQFFPMPLLRLFYPSRGNYIAVVDQLSSGHARKMKKVMSMAMTVPVYSINAPFFVPGVDFSDHRNFWKHGYPAVMVTDTAFYRNPNYHSPNDTAEKLDYDKMADVVYGVFSYVMHLTGDSDLMKAKPLTSNRPDKN